MGYSKAIVKDNKSYVLAYNGEISKTIKENEETVLFKNNRILKESGVQVQEFFKEKK